MRKSEVYIERISVCNDFEILEEYGIHCDRAMALSLKIREEHSIQYMPCSPQMISELLPEIMTKGKYDFLIPITHSLINSLLPEIGHA